MKALTAGQLTKAALTILETKGYFVWRNNNLSVPGRKFIGLKGIPDIVGFCKKSGKAVYCEVKTENDKLSEYQVNFMTRAKDSGCICFMATDINGYISIKLWE